MEVIEDFQSHYGLILSVYTSLTPAKQVNSFNPTMVWFYLIANVPYEVYITNFQSHYGLILSLWVPQVNVWLRRTFNPTMVWFYLYEFLKSMYDYDVLSIPLWSDFIGYSDRDIKKLKLTFNPTMVWFYRNGPPRPSLDFSFQSHYGLILSQMQLRFGLRMQELFQSHYGLILS